MQVLNGKAIELREMGKGKKTNVAEILTEEIKVYVLEAGNPENLHYTIFYMTSHAVVWKSCMAETPHASKGLKFVKMP